MNGHRELMEVSPERPRSWLERRLAGARELARQVFLRSGKPFVPPPTLELRMSDWKIVPGKRDAPPPPIGEKNAELKAASKQWHPPGL